VVARGTGAQEPNRLIAFRSMAKGRDRPTRRGLAVAEQQPARTRGSSAEPQGDGQLAAEFVETWRDAAYNCFSSGHKFCREVCPVMQVTRDEAHSPTAFHTNVVAMEQGHLTVEDVARDYVHCTQCGACELRCPNTLFTGDFYRFRTRTVALVKAMRVLAVDSGVHQPNWRRWVEATDQHRNEPVLGDVPVTQEHVADWAKGLGIPVGGETILFCDCEGAFFRPSVPRAVAQILRAAGVGFGLMREQWCCGGPAAEMGYVERSRAFAEHNVDDWRAVGAKRIIVFDPHDYIAFTEDYPGYFGDGYDFEILLMVELVAELIREGKLSLNRPVHRVVTYHDACRLNKRKGIHEAPREILRAIPGLTFRDVDHVTQWSYCSGAGGGLGIERPDLTEEISRRRVERAAALGVDTLVSACVWSERPLEARGGERHDPIEVVDLMELVAQAAGLDQGLDEGEAER
jgi:heterodisulfide reductase subunit D